MKHMGTDVCLHGEFRLHVTWVRDIESLPARKMRKCIHCGILSDGFCFFFNEIHYPRDPRKSFRMLLSSLPRLTQAELLGPDTKVNRGLNLSLENSQVPAVTAVISTTDAFSFVTIMKVLPQPEPRSLQIPLDHTEDWRGRVVWNISHSAIRPSPWVHCRIPLSPLLLYPHQGWVGVVSVPWGWQSMSVSLSSTCDAVTKCGILLPALQKATKRPAS